MNKSQEAPKANKTIRRLRRRAAEDEMFCQLACDMRELFIEAAAPIRELKDATILAIFEHAWSMYRIQQGMQLEGFAEEEAIEPDENDED